MRAARSGLARAGGFATSRRRKLMQETDNVEYGNLGALPAEDRTGPAWESRSGMGLVRSLLVTLQGSMLGPSRFFRTMRRGNGFFDPLVYAMIFGSLSIVISVVWELALATARTPFFDAGSPEELLRMGPVLYGLTIILSPIAATILVLVTSVILHVVLVVLGGANHGFRTSFRVVCYSQGTGMLNLVPYLGAFTGSVWNLVLLAIGLREAHQAPAWKAVLAVLGLLAVWLGLVIALGLLVVAAGLL